MKVDSYSLPLLGARYDHGHRLSDRILFDMILGAAGAAMPQDFGPNSLHGISSNAPTMAPNGMVFNGTNQFITIGNVPTLALADNFTICVWIRPGTTGARTIVSKWNPDISSNEWRFGWWYTDGFRFDTTSGMIEGSRTFTYGRMYFGAVRMLNGTAAIFFNGIADTTGARSITPGAANVVIGRVDNSSLYVDGTVERVLIYGRPLLHSEIRDLYEAPYSMFVRPNLKRFFIGAATADEGLMGFRKSIRMVGPRKYPITVLQ